MDTCRHNPEDDDLELLNYITFSDKFTKADNSYLEKTSLLS